MTRITQDNLSPTASYGHIPGLNGLRALSVLIVILAHMGFEHIIPGGFGVTVFFFISGMLITRLLLAESELKGKVNLPKFYMRRIIRLYPALLFMLYLTTCIYIILNFGSPTIMEATAGIGYFTNVFQVISTINETPSFMPWRHLWSLSVEEHFYIGFPILVLAFRKNWRALSLTLVGIICASLLWRCYIAFGTQLPANEYNYMMTDTRIDSLAWGCLISVLLHSAGSINPFKHLIGARPFIIGLIGIALSFLIRDDSFRYTLRFTVQGAALFVLLLNLYYWRALSFAFLILDWKPFAWIGSISYGLYLWHVPMIDMFSRSFGDNIGIRILAVIASFAIAAFSFHYVEKPFIVLRQRYGSHVTGGKQQPA